MKLPMPLRRCAACTLVAAAATGALAQDVPPVLAPAAAPAQALPAPVPTPTRGPGGSTARDWLELQRSGRAGSAHPVAGEIATLSWRRYVDSFRQPIPESFSSPLRQADDGR